MPRYLFFLCVAVAAAVTVFVVMSRSSESPEGVTLPQVTTTTIDLSDVDVAELDPTRGVPVTPAGPSEAATLVPTEAVRYLGDANALVSVFLAPCAQLSEVTVTAPEEPGGSYTAEVRAEDVDCSEERVLVAVEARVR